MKRQTNSHTCFLCLLEYFAHVDNRSIQSILTLLYVLVDILKPHLFTSRARFESEPHNIMAIGDVVLKHTRFQDRCVRDTNLMDPVYRVNGIDIQDEPKSKPRPLKQFIPENHQLQTHDIEGAFTGWGQRTRREIRNIMNTLDVPGAQADTIVHSMKSDRVTNPLTPVYASLDGAPLPPLVVPLMPASFVDRPTHSQKAKTSGIHNAAPATTTVPRSAPNLGRRDIPKLSLQPQTNAPSGYSARSYASKADDANIYI
jgi:hypothetical protein